METIRQIVKDARAAQINADDLIAGCKTIPLEQLPGKTESRCVSTRPKLTAAIPLMHEKLSKVKEILKSLTGPKFKLRESQIAPAYENTCNWMFGHGPDEASLESTSFLEWLHASEGIFLISGKAGAGKSTLMKYLCQSDKTLQALRKWADPLPVMIFQHFF